MVIMDKKYSDGELIAELQRLAEELERVPVARDVEDKASYSLNTYQRYFGSWTAAREAAGLPEPGTWETSKEPYKDEGELRRLYIDEDMTQVEIAEELGVSDSTISNWIRHFGIEKEPDYPWRDADRLRELYWNKEHSIHEIADRWDTHGNIIHRWMRRHDIPRRQFDRSEREFYDKELLERLYWDEGLSQRQIAERFGETQVAVSDVMIELGVNTRGFAEGGWVAKRVNRAYFRTNRDGYEIAGSRCGDETFRVSIHRLVAVAEYGFEEVSKGVVHHRNEIPWDNRPSNLEVMSDREHKRHHAKTRGELPPEGF